MYAYYKHSLNKVLTSDYLDIIITIAHLCPEMMATVVLVYEPSVTI